MRHRNPPTVVSITPVAVEADSRTYKYAASFARLGYQAIVVEGLASQPLARRVPFQLRTVRRPLGSSRLPAPQQGRGSLIRCCLQTPWRTLKFLGSIAVSWLPAAADLQFTLLYLGRFLYEYGLAPCREIPKADVYHLHGHLLYPAVRARSLFHRAPLIYDAHDFYPALRTRPGYWGSSRVVGRILERFHQALEQRCVTHASAVVTVSDGVADLIERRFGRRPIVIRNAHDPRIDPPRGFALRGLLGLNEEPFLVAVVGQAKSGMAVGAALDALRRLPDHVRMVFIGGGYEALVGRIPRGG